MDLGGINTSVRVDLSGWKTAINTVQTDLVAFSSLGASASARLSTAMGQIVSSTSPVEEAFKALGLRSSGSIDDAKARIMAAFGVIRTSGTASAADLTRAQSAYEAQMQQLTKESVPQASQSILGLSEKWEHLAETVLGFSLANVLNDVRAWVMESITMAVQAQRQEQAFRLVAASVGVQADAMLKGLREASRGMVDESDAMQSAAFALQQGLDPNQIVQLMGVARTQAKLAGTDVSTAFDQITMAVTTQMTRGLKAYGIVIDQTKAYEDYARKLGVAKESLNEVGQSQALLAAVLDAMSGKSRALAGATETADEKQQKFHATIKDFRDRFGGLFVDGIVNMVRGVESLGDKLSDAVTKIDAWLGSLEKTHPWLLALITAGGSLNRTLDTTAAKSAEVAAAWEQELYGAAKVVTQQAFDPLINAMTTADKTLTQLTGQLTLGNISAETFAAGLQAQIAALQALPNPTEEVRAKILALQVTFHQFAQQQNQDAIARGKDAIETAQRMVDADTFYAGQRAMLHEQLLNFDRTEEDQAVAAEQEKSRVAIEKLYDVLGETQQAADLGVAIVDNELKNIAAIRQKATLAEGQRIAGDVQVREDAEEKIRELARETSDQIIKISGSERDAQEADAWKELTARVQAIDQLVASSEAKAKAIELIWAAYSARVIAIDNTTTQQRLALVDDYYQKVQDLLGGETGKETREYGQRLADIGGYYQSLLADTSLSAGERAAIEARYYAAIAKAQNEHYVKADAARKTDAVKDLETLAGSQEKHGQFFAFLGTSIKLAALQMDDWFQGGRRLVSETVQAMQRSLSDGLFNFFKTGVLDAKKIFQDFLDSMLRSLSDMLASAAVKGVLGLLIGSIPGFATGGAMGASGQLVPITGTNGDTFLARLGTGEVVLTAQQAQALGLNTGVGGPVTLSAAQAQSSGILSGTAGSLLQQGASTAISSYLTGGGGLIPGLLNIGTNFTEGGLLGVLQGTSFVTTGPSGGLVMNTAPGFIGNGGQSPLLNAAGRIVDFVSNLFGGGGGGGVAGASAAGGAVGATGGGIGVFTSATATPSELAAMGATGAEISGVGSSVGGFSQALGAFGVYAMAAAPVIGAIIQALFPEPSITKGRQEAATLQAIAFANAIPLAANANDVTALLNLRTQMDDLINLAPDASTSDAVGIVAKAKDQIQQLLDLRDRMKADEASGNIAEASQIAQWFSDLHQQGNIAAVGYPILADQTRSQAHVAYIQQAQGVDTATAVQIAVAQGDIAAGQAAGWVDPTIALEQERLAALAQWEATVNPTAGGFDQGGYARVHDGEVMVPRPFADDFPTWAEDLAALHETLQSGGAGVRVTIGQITITGANKSTKELARELADDIERELQLRKDRRIKVSGVARG